MTATRSPSRRSISESPPKLLNADGSRNGTTIVPGSRPTVQVASDVGDAVHRHVRAEGLEDQPLRLEGVDFSRRTGELGELQGVRPDVRPDLHDDVAGPDDLPEEVRLAEAVFAVELERLADIAIVDVVKHDAEPARFPTVEPGRHWVASRGLDGGPRR